MEQNVDRATLQNAIFDQLVIPQDQYTYIYKQFWVNQFNKNSLRLSKRGFVLLSKTLKLEYFIAHLEESEDINHGELILEIDRVMTCPYFLDITGEMDIFGEKERAWLALHNDRIRPFLASWK
jgi:hypothetical protein